MQFAALPVGLVTLLAVFAAWRRVGLADAVRLRGLPVEWLPLGVLLSIPLLIAVHELLHAAVHPQGGRSPATVIGAWPSRLLFYAHYCGPLSRDRFLAVLLMPLVVITLLPLGIAASGWLPPAAVAVLAWFSCWNALFACGDLVGFALIACQVPRRALVQNQGWRTFWKRASKG
jgi:hypothetical protein